MPLVTLPEVKDCVTVTVPAAAAVAPTDKMPPVPPLAVNSPVVTVTFLPPLMVTKPAANVELVAAISVVAAAVKAIAFAPAFVAVTLVMPVKPVTFAVRGAFLASPTHRPTAKSMHWPVLQ